MCDVLEQSGQDLVRAAYWDWGDLSDLNSTYKVWRCLMHDGMMNGGG
jgi:hypothetical protein